MFCVYCTKTAKYDNESDHSLDLVFLESIQPTAKLAMDKIRELKREPRIIRNGLISVYRNYYSLEERIEPIAA